MKSIPHGANFRRHIVKATVLSLVGLATAGLAVAQTAWTPTKPIKLIVPYAPGGGTDVLARIVVSSLGNSLGQPVIVENRPGANGIVGANAVFNAPPDGTTLLFAAADFISVAPHVYKKAVQFQPNGFRAVAPVAKMGFVLAGKSDGEAKTLQELVSKAKAKQQYSYGHWGPGSMAQMGMELLKSKAGIHGMLEVPFGGAAPMMTAVLGGQVNYAFIPTPLAIANKTKLKLYALGSPERFPVINDVPTLTESGYAIDADTWFGVLAPPNTPQTAVDAIQAQIAKVVNDPAVKARMADMGYTPMTADPHAFASFVEAENARWGAVVKAANIKVEE